jgi:hypothetical protein
MVNLLVASRRQYRKRSAFAYFPRQGGEKSTNVEVQCDELRVKRGTDSLLLRSFDLCYRLVGRLGSLRLGGWRFAVDSERCAYLGFDLQGQLWVVD